LEIILQTALQNKKVILKIILKIFLDISLKTLKNKILQNWYIHMIEYSASQSVYSVRKPCPRKLTNF